ncbi:N-acetyltransferase [Arthrobacter sp. ISL-69]|uniref:GNAT family N-acetyltransferase n=1 Tax=Arthrobacter sp. ISL-69 TaxID=2819113 RepID=UPI002034D6FB|nr:GNAT family N-acetyltransferase [Arthrobacter sp. ISL-69]
MDRLHRGTRSAGPGDPEFSFCGDLPGRRRRNRRLARAISDDATICYVQDILVTPTFQGSGAGRAMLEAIQSRYRHVRQTVLITDNGPGQRAFYQALGFTDGSDFSPEPLSMFAQFR